jgi:hypothetical protein
MKSKKGEKEKRREEKRGGELMSAAFDAHPLLLF